MDRRLTGINPLAYMGVEPLSPPNLVVEDHNPTSFDGANLVLGTFWMTVPDKTQPATALFVLAGLIQGSATWIQIMSGAGEIFSLTTEDGNVVLPQLGTVFVLGDNGNISTIGNPLLNQVIIDLDDDIEVTTVTTTGDVDCGANVNATSNLTSGAALTVGTSATIGNGLTVTTGAVTLSGKGTGVMYLAADVVGSIANGAVGEVLTINGGGVPVWAPPAGGGGGTTSFTTNVAGPALPDGGGALTVTGAPLGFISTDGGTANTVTLNPGVGSNTDGNVWIGGTSGGQWAQITGVNGIIVTNGDGTIQLDGSGIAPGTGMTLAHSQSGNATINAGDNSFTFNGAGFLTTSATGSTVTIQQVTNPIISGNIRFSSYGAGVLATSSTGAISAIQGSTAFPPGNNQFLMSRPTGTTPIFGTITAADASIVITQSPTGITLRAPAGGGGSGSRSFLYSLGADIPNGLSGATPTYIFGSTTALTQIFDRAGAPQFVGTTFTASTTGIYSFNIGINVTPLAGSPVLNTLSVVVTDGVTPANSRTYRGNTLNSVGLGASSNQGGFYFSIMVPMTATATAQFTATSINGGGGGYGFTIQGSTTVTTFVSGYFVQS